MYERVERVSGTGTISTAPSAFSRPGRPETRQRPHQKQRGCGKPSLMAIGTPSHAMAASTRSWTRSTRRARKRRSRPEQNDRRFSPPGVKDVPSYGCPPFRRGVAHAGGARF